jgi:hypothetical protein
VVEDVVADPAPGQEARLSRVDGWGDGGCDASGDGPGGDLDVGVDAGDGAAVAGVTGVAFLGDEGVVGGALALWHVGLGLESLVGIEGVGEGGAEDVPQLKVHFGGEAIRARALAALECFGGNVELVGGEGGVAVCGGGSSDGGVEGGEELVLCDAWCWAFRKVLGEVGGYDLLCAAEAFVAVDVDGGGGVGIEDRGEAGVAVVAWVAAGVEVVSGLLEEHEFERLRPLQIPLAEAAAVGCQCGCGGPVGCHGGGAGGVCACLRQLRRSKADGALQPVAVGADALAVGSMAVVGEDADAGDDVLKEAWGVGVFILCLEARAVWGGGWLELAEEGGRILSCILVVESVGLEAIHRGLQVVDEVLVGE